MSPSTARILFHSPSRRGLGHVMRSANLARATLASDPAAVVLLHVANPAAGEVLGPDIPWTAEDPTAPGRWAQLVETFRPSLVVFDTLLPGDWVTGALPQAFVWRRCVPERHRAILEDGRLRRMRVVVVPHTREEGDYGLPADLARRTVYTGPIVRASSPEGRSRVRDRYGIQDGEMVVTSTMGGGGFDESAAWLRATVVAAHDEMAARVPRLRHILVLGPLSGIDRPSPRPGLTVVDTEPDLVDLFAVSELVVAEAGYNTVQEIRQLGVPTVLVPGDRTFDDQMGRAAALAARGVARVVGRQSMSAAAQAVVALAADPEARLAMRDRAARERIPTGNELAAATLLEAAR